MAPSRMADGKIDLILVSLILSCVSHLFSLLLSAGGGDKDDRRMAAFARCVESPFVIPFVALRADVITHDIVAGQDAARQATGKRGASSGRDGTGSGMA